VGKAPGDVRLLLVDDSPETLEFLDNRLRALGFRTTILRDGAQAIAAVRSDPPDLVVLDVTMPEVNGFQACREIKKLKKNLPVILLTAKSNPADRFWGRESGADEFLNKPIDPQLVVQRIVALLERAA
jgi:DNA-binding response OmpR family regulator